MRRRLLNLLTAVLLLLLCGVVAVLWVRGYRLTVFGLLLVFLLLVWRRSYKVSYVFGRYGRTSGVILTISWGQFRLYLNNRRAGLNETTGSFCRVWRFAPTFDVNRSPMDHTHWRLGGFSYAHGENTKTHVRYRLASLPIWVLTILLCVAAVALAGEP